jgi:membrane peptidoglycan carboxypeptidase
LENWTASSIGSLAMGQEINVSPLQIISAVSAIANGGTLYRPRILKEIGGDAPPNSVQQSAPQQSISQRTAATLREMMEAVILEGTGKPAQLSGYTAAGKSGTAQKIDPATGRYSPNQYIASFVGFAPVNTPAVTILAVFDSPVGLHHGGDVGGPVFKRAAEQILAYLDVPHDVTVAPDTQTAKDLRPGPRPAAQSDADRVRFQAAVEKQVSSSSAAPTVAFGEDEAVVVPNLAGQTVRGVTEACSRMGLVPSLIGTGVALEQSPEAGARVLRGSRLTVRFGRPGEATPATTGGDGN